MRTAVISGATVSGLTTARLLLRQQWSVTLRVGRRRPGPVVLLKDLTVRLLLELWRAGDDLLSGAHPLTERLVRDSAGRRFLQDDVAWSVPAELLRDRLLGRLLEDSGDRLRVIPSEQTDPASDDDPDGWTLAADGRRSRDGHRCAGALVCGRRTIIAALASSQPAASSRRSSFELVSNGWLFVAPCGPDRAVVQLMVPVLDGTPDQALRCALSSSEIARETIRSVVSPPAVWPAWPESADPWPGATCLRVGDAAMTCDPICGDGTGNALRGAILAAAAIEAIESGEAPSAVRAHYRNRLEDAFLRHLATCLEMYQRFPGHSWDHDVARMTLAMKDRPKEAASLASFSYRLLDGRLVKLPDASDAPPRGNPPGGPVRLENAPV